jgi:hypothetical protein
MKACVQNFMQSGCQVAELFTVSADVRVPSKEGFRVGRGLAFLSEPYFATALDFHALCLTDDSCKG